ncbi:MAG: 23S rRNA (adenine(2030)-N(6))-methyltransferase RlmJ [Gammaproteobacteria bacterium]|nr:23S rRNA (adenine(2030)-N(6))-methyltransferase RlmJ [Gammaproteobacteria bacterium]
MKYDHRYHAGNFCDIFKQTILLQIVKYLQQKAKPLCFLDLHGGHGVYPIKELSQEAHSGIISLMQSADCPDIFKTYLNCIHHWLDHGLFPGTPQFFYDLLRENDRLWVSERYEEPFSSLTQLFQNRNQVFLKQMDGYEMAKSLLPPVEKRALICIDPPYERPEEYEQLNFAIKEIFAKRFPTGVYVIWYPFGKRASAIQEIQYTCESLWGREKVLHIEGSLISDTENVFLKNNGLTIINAPFGLKSWIENHANDWKALNLQICALGQS